MPAFRSVLLAADFSESSREAFLLACSLAHEQKTRLVVLHVVERMPIVEQAVAFGDAGEVVPLEGGQPHHDALRERLVELYAPSHPIDVSYVVRDGDPAGEVLRLAHDVGADLIVMGTHGRTGLRRLLAGSVAESVLRKAGHAVLALRGAEQPGRSVSIGTIVHPVELEEPSEVALSAARSLAREQGARLVLVYVAPLDLMLNPRGTLFLDLEDYERALEAIRARTDGPDLKYPVEARLERGAPAGEILRVARETGCDLIVMGTHGRSGLSRFLAGSVAEAVLRGSHCPVLAVKEAASVVAEA
ncbi:MAG: universal stress protein [Isosphaeraceae bacterium]|nr:universal stress protein [Isosphaeraceae bacterium]